MMLGTSTGTFPISLSGPALTQLDPWLQQVLTDLAQCHIRDRALCSSHRPSFSVNLVSRLPLPWVKGQPTDTKALMPQTLRTALMSRCIFPAVLQDGTWGCTPPLASCVTCGLPECPFAPL